MSFSFVFPLVGGSGGGGTVSSVGLSMPTNDFNISNSPVTGSDTIAVTYKSQIQNLIFGSPDGIAGTPLFRYLVGADLPSATTSVKGALPIATDAEALAGSITDKTIVPETLSYTFLNRQIGAITAINSAILATDTINGAFAKTQGQINAKQNTLTIGNITGSEFSITGGVGAVIGTGVSLSLAASGVTANTYGSSTVVPVLTVNSKGVVTGVTNTSIAFPPSSVTSVFGRTGPVVSQSGDYTFAQIGSTPTTLAGYGITDAIASGGSGLVSDISITGLAGSGFLNLRYQSSTPVGLANYGTLYADSIGNIGYKKNANSFTNSLYFSGTADRVYTLQDRSGTLADNFDLATKLDLSGANANQDIDIGNFSLNAKHVKINGTGGAGHIGLKHQSADITASASESSIGADSVGDPVWKNDGGAIDKLELQSNKTGTVTGNEASTSKYLTVKGVYDWAVGLFAPKASPTFTGTVTTPDIIVSGATVNTIAHFDATKNIESLPLATYPSLTELSYVKGVTSAIQTQLINGIEFAVESWTTDAPYTTQNTTAKRLIILHSGPLSTSRSLILTSPSVSQEVIVVAGATVSATNKIVVVPAYKINGNSFNSIDIVLPHSQTWLTYVGNAAGGFPTGTWSTSQASPQFTETLTTLTASKYVGTLSGFNLPNSTSLTAPFPTGFVEGSMTYNRGTNALLVRNNVAQTAVFLPYILETGWKDYYVAGNVLKYWDGTNNIASTLKPIEWGLNTVWNRQYTLEHYPSDGTDAQPFRCIFQVNSTGVPSILQVLQSDGVNQYTVSGGQLVLSGLRGYTTVKLRNHSLTNKLPELYEKYSADGQTRFLTGTGGLGIGHTSQNASAILQADSTTKGLLPPRMTNTQRTNIVSPAVGLMVYCTDATEGLYIYKSTGWTFII